jgi:hypothetical protein
MKEEITFWGPTVAAARHGEHRSEQCRSSGCVIWKHRFHTATQLHRRPFSQQILSAQIYKIFIHSFISSEKFLFFVWILI